MSGQVKVVTIFGSQTTNGTSSTTGTGRGGQKVFQSVLASTATGAATILVQASLDNVNFVTQGTLTLAGTTSTISASYIPTVPAAWAYWRATISSIGTQSTVWVYCGEEC